MHFDIAFCILLAALYISRSVGKDLESVLIEPESKGIAR